ncbi:MULTISPECIES: hypothetical protein [Enterococcus]|uniref:Uncharacterized protein n=1 Tax=Enterococcus mundtii TaxID=53346 RepID=A0ABQ0VBM9_ENTMU|nr:MULTISPECIES: hypothetical protein [Enterococcus]OJG62875.1 hypothetical protein RV08_GL001877 [Enterococcus mundtii]GEL79901.1 hypothetical protein EMU01_10450 [Enterococcus mundtii]GEN17475.1 hypothetical protein LAC02_07560 [Ligilactobacillus acidipiscis]
MDEKGQVWKIVNKYNKSISYLSENATAKELNTVMMYSANEEYRRQRKLVGLAK